MIVHLYDIQGLLVCEKTLPLSKTPPSVVQHDGRYYDLDRATLDQHKHTTEDGTAISSWRYRYLEER